MVLERRRPCLVSKNFWFGYYSTFVFIWQILSSHEVTRLKDSYRGLQAKCAISIYFHLYLMFYACTTRFDVMENFKKFWFFLTEQGPETTYDTCIQFHTYVTWRTVLLILLVASARVQTWRTVDASHYSSRATLLGSTYRRMVALCASRLLFLRLVVDRCGSGWTTVPVWPYATTHTHKRQSLLDYRCQPC